MPGAGRLPLVLHQPTSPALRPFLPGLSPSTEVVPDGLVTLCDSSLLITTLPDDNHSQAHHTRSVLCVSSVSLTPREAGPGGSLSSFHRHTDRGSREGNELSTSRHSVLKPRFPQSQPAAPLKRHNHKHTRRLGVGAPHSCVGRGDIDSWCQTPFPAVCHLLSPAWVPL